MTDLYERLREIRRNRKPDDGMKKRTSIRDSSPGHGWDRLGEGVYRRVRRLPLPRAAGRVRSGGVWGALSSVLRCGESLTPVFLDVETSGLSGGAGSVAFLVGLGILEAGDRSDDPGRDGSDGSDGSDGTDSIAVEQFFLSDLAAESEYVYHLHRRIDRISSAIPPGDAAPLTYVTYNGASFDLPILRSRAIMVRQLFPEHAHLDLLPVTRRLYARTVGSCNLATVERSVLLLNREVDVPGIEVPQRYLEFLRTGERRHLQPVLEHHYQDIANLAILAMHLNGVLSSPDRTLGRSRETPDTEGILPDIPDLLRLLVERGGPEEQVRAEQLIARRVRETDPRYAAGSPREQWCRLAYLQARVARSRGAWEELLEVLRALYQVRATPEVAVDLAKQLEHKVRDYRGALEVVTEAGQRWGWTATLNHRAQRLNRRISRSRDRAARTAERNGPS